MNTYEELGLSVGRLVTEKQDAYGDSFGQSGKVLEILYPDGVQPEQYKDMQDDCQNHRQAVQDSQPERLQW